MTTALEVGIACSNGEIVKTMKQAKRNIQGGALTLSGLVATAACLEATLDAITSGDDSNMRTTLLKQKAVVQVVIASALAKLKNML